MLSRLLTPLLPPSPSCSHCTVTSLARWSLYNWATFDYTEGEGEREERGKDEKEEEEGEKREREKEEEEGEKREREKEERKGKKGKEKVEEKGKERKKEKKQEERMVLKRIVDDQITMIK